MLYYWEATYRYTWLVFISENIKVVLFTQKCAEEKNIQNVEHLNWKQFKILNLLRLNLSDLENCFRVSFHGSKMVGKLEEQLAVPDLDTT